ncbi:MAG: type II toxin-antitoxin system PemK/MazF family toxin [Chloroflexi bacterium]|nr:type II toxin-antitoxin system PemK/MazF family toxin [Chloroflexota bacterium]
MQRSEIWLVNLDPTVGAEISKTRPALIVSDDNVGKLPLRIVAPITDWKDRYTIAPWMIRIDATAENGLSKSSAIDTFQLRSIATERFIRKLGNIADEKVNEVERGLILVLRLPIKMLK